jgi:hypothetical protein
VQTSQRVTDRELAIAKKHQLPGLGGASGVLYVDVDSRSPSIDSTRRARSPKPWAWNMSRLSAWVR